MGLKKLYPAVLLAVFFLIIPAVQGGLILKNANWANETFLVLSTDRWDLAPSTDFHAYQAHEETLTRYCDRQADECRPIWRLVLTDYGVQGDLGWYRSCSNRGNCDRGVCAQGLSCNTDTCINASNGDYLYTDDDGCEHYDTREWRTGYKCEVYSDTGGHPVVFWCRCNGQKVGAGSWCDNGDGETYNTRWVSTTEAISGKADYGGLDCGGLLESKGFTYETGRGCCCQSNEYTYEQYYKPALSSQDLETLLNHTRCWIQGEQLRSGGTDFQKYYVIEGTPTTEGDYISCLIDYSDWQENAINGHVADQVGPGTAVYFDFSGKDLELEPECRTNSDCGENYWTGDPECCNGDGWHICKAYHGYECRNPGTEQAYCFEWDGYKQVQECQNQCQNNVCPDDPEPEEPNPEEPQNPPESCTESCNNMSGYYCDDTFLELRNYGCSNDSCKYSVSERNLCVYGCKKSQCNPEPACYPLTTAVCKDERTMQTYIRFKTEDGCSDWTPSEEIPCQAEQTCIGAATPGEGTGSCLSKSQQITLSPPMSCETYEDCPFKYMMCVQNACIPRFRLFEDFDFENPYDSVNPSFEGSLDYLGIIGKVYTPLMIEDTGSPQKSFEKIYAQKFLQEQVTDPAVLNRQVYFDVELYASGKNQQIDVLVIENGKIVVIAEPTIQTTAADTNEKFMKITEFIPNTEYITVKGAGFRFKQEQGKIIPEQMATTEPLAAGDAFKNSANFRKIVPTTWTSNVEQMELKKLIEESIEPEFVMRRASTEDVIQLIDDESSKVVLKWIRSQTEKNKWASVYTNPFLRYAGNPKAISADDYSVMGKNTAAMGALYLSYQLLSYYDMWEAYVKAQEFQKTQSEMCGTDAKTATEFYDTKAASLLNKYDSCRNAWEAGQFEDDCDEFIAGAELESFFFYYFQDICTKQLIGLYGPDYGIPADAESIKELYQLYLDMPLHNKCTKTLYFDLDGKTQPDKATSKIIPSDECSEYTITLPMYQKRMHQDDGSYGFIRQLHIEADPAKAEFSILSPKINNLQYTMKNKNFVWSCLEKGNSCEVIYTGVFSVEITPKTSETITFTTETGMTKYIKATNDCFAAPKPKPATSGGGGGGGGGSSSAKTTQAPAVTTPPAQPSLAQKWAAAGGLEEGAEESTAKPPEFPKEEPAKTEEPPKTEAKKEEPKTVLTAVTSVFVRILTKTVFPWLSWFNFF